MGAEQMPGAEEAEQETGIARAARMASDSVSRSGHDPCVMAGMAAFCVAFRAVSEGACSRGSGGCTGLFGWVPAGWLIWTEWGFHGIIYLQNLSVQMGEGEAVRGFPFFFCPGAFVVDADRGEDRNHDLHQVGGCGDGVLLWSGCGADRGKDSGSMPRFVFV